MTSPQTDKPAANQPSQSSPPASTHQPSHRGGVGGQIIMVAIVLAICGGGAWWWSHHEAGKKIAPAHTGQSATQEVDAIVVAKSNAPITLEYLGQTAFTQRVDIRARVKGFLETRTFEEGGMVKKGQVLYTIERSTFEASLEAAKAQLAQAEARHDQAAREVTRFSDLVKQNAASQRELDDFKTSVKVFAADMQAAKAQIQQAQLDLDYTVIASPINGVISQTKQDVGNYVGDGSDESLLAVVGQENPIYVQFSVSEQDLLKWHSLASSQSVDQTQNTLSVQALLSSGEIYPQTGKLNFVDTNVDPTTGTAMLRAVFDNTNHLLRPGQFIRVKITGLVQNDVLTIPQKAVIQSPAGAMVYVVDKEGKAQIRPIMLGNWIGDRWIINQGLNLGDKVIVNRLLKLRPDSPVNATIVDVDTVAHASDSKDKNAAKNASKDTVAKDTVAKAKDTAPDANKNATKVD